jgi:hypothetical protein
MKALAGGRLPPGLKRLRRGFNRAVDILLTCFGDRRDRLLVRGVLDVERGARRRGDFLSVDPQAAGPEVGASAARRSWR